MSEDPIVIVGIARTPMGGFQGNLSTVTSTELGSAAISAAVERAGISPDQVDETLMGCVLPAGLGQAPARQASIGAGLPKNVPCTTINKMCGSGMKAIMMAHDTIKAGISNIVVAGGMESMTNAPYILPKARGGLRIGHSEVKDHMFIDGLEDAYEKGSLMGKFAEETATAYQFTRSAQDQFAIESLKRANNAIDNGSFQAEITPITIRSRNGESQVTIDEQPGRAKPEKIPSLRPAFSKNGTVTAANSSSISDGAAALVLMKQSEALKRKLIPMAAIRGHSSHAQEPSLFTTAPIGALFKLFTQTGWSKDDVDLFEINEAFAVVTMAAMQELNIPHEKVNIYGGACALGHPIGASGARISVTLLNALKNEGKTKGVATLCIGGGEAVAIAVELLN
ncbi:MAG: acetyl-CoA C-acyltransferase [Sphingomonadales bacterium]